MILQIKKIYCILFIIFLFIFLFYLLFHLFQKSPSESVPDVVEPRAEVVKHY